MKTTVKYIAPWAVTAVPGGPAFRFGGRPRGSALLVVKRGLNAGARFLLDRATTTAGRHPNSDIFLDEITVSRRHAEFQRAIGEFRVVDVGDLNGTYVNREPVDSAVLVNGDEVEIGRFRLVFLIGPTTSDTLRPYPQAHSRDCLHGAQIAATELAATTPVAAARPPPLTQ